VNRDLLPTIPRHVARSLAAGMGELHCYRDLGMLAHRGDDRPQRRLGSIVPQAEASGRDPADASTWVASMQNIAAPDSASVLTWVKCQSLASPFTAEYWHIGATMMRFGKAQTAQLDRGKQKRSCRDVRTGREIALLLAGQRAFLNAPSLFGAAACSASAGDRPIILRRLAPVEHAVVTLDLAHPNARGLRRGGVRLRAGKRFQ